LEAISDATGLEVAPLGIKVTVIEPGLFRTDFLDGSSLVRMGRTIDDYATTAGGSRDWATDTNHAEPGDPVKAAAAMLAIVDAEDPPSRLQLGADSVARVRGKLDHVAREADEWHDLSVSTDHEAAVPEPGR
jgi:NAD(P)-dependent dehydrogenase (short-subunit alcohol dehydrogenase family)